MNRPPLRLFDPEEAEDFIGMKTAAFDEDWEERKRRLLSEASEKPWLELLAKVTPDMFLQAIVLAANRRSQSGPRYGGYNPPTDEEYRAWADHAERGFCKAAQFLHRQCVFDSKDIPELYQLVTLSALYVLRGDALYSEDAREKLERWFWAGAFGGYGKGWDSNCERDTIDFPKYLQGGVLPRTISELRLEGEDLVSSWSRSYPVYKAAYALLMKSGALSRRFSGRPVDFAVWKREKIELQRIFPKKWFEENGSMGDIAKSFANSIINKAPMDADTRDAYERLGGNRPSILVGIFKGRFDEILESQRIDPDAVRRDKLGLFFALRMAALLELIGCAVGKDLGGGA